MHLCCLRQQACVARRPSPCALRQSSSSESEGSDQEDSSSSWGSEGGSQMQEEQQTDQELAAAQCSRQRRRRTGSTGHTAGPNNAAAAAAAARADRQPQHSGHPPYSSLLWCETTVQQSRLRVSSALCRDMLGGGSSSGSTALQVSVLVHAASWEVKQYILSQMQPAAAAATAAGQRQATQIDSGCQTWGPFTASLAPEGKAVLIRQVQHSNQLTSFWELMAAEPHCVVLQERVRTTATAQQQHIHRPACCGRQDSSQHARWLPAHTSQP
jgi:hypothetical protein